MKTFCPNCEKETNCVYIAELYECKECGCEFESKQRQMQERLDAAETRLAERGAEVSRLTEALSAANEDAARLDKLVMDAVCRQTSEIDTNAGLDAHRAHIARVGGAS